MALKENETHISPIHLLDIEDGTYNLSYLRKYLPDRELVLIKGVKRIQGIIVPKGNPRNIRSLTDIVVYKHTFVNRQRGSGTRVFLDYRLKKMEIDPYEICGFEREVYTHTAVAAAVESGDVDCGLGIYSAAELMKLDFIELGEEEYDFAVPKEYMDMKLIKELVRILKSREFKEELDKLGGYGYEGIGQTIEVK